MPTLKARILGSWIGDRLLREARVVEVADLGASFRKIRIAAPAVTASPPAAGDKVQVFVPDVGTRTFSPFDVDPGAGAFSLLGYAHDERSPAADWLRGVAAGATVRYVPGHSLALAAFPAPIGLFGDETSFGVAGSLRAMHADATVRFEVTSVAAAAPAAATLGLPADALVAATDDGGHFGAIADALARATASGGTLVLTGRARSIQALRALLRAKAAGRRVVTKPYWADGKTGLD